MQPTQDKPDRSNKLDSKHHRTQEPFRLGEWSVNPRTNHIAGPAASHTLEPKVMDLLVEMAAEPGRVFSRDELLDRVWGDVVVGEEVLTRAISELRRLLEDDSRAPRYIETIRKRGYRIIAERRTISREPVVDTEPRHHLEEESVTGSNVPARTGFPRLLVLAIACVGIAIAGLWARQMLRGAGGGSDRETVPWHPRPLTSYVGNEVTPALSPDGKIVAFSWTGPEDDNYDIYVLQIGDAAPLRLTEEPAVDIHPVWSPDGMRLAYISDKGPGAEIRIVPVLGGSSRLVTKQSLGLGGGFSWSPDGSSIVYATRPTENSPNQLYVLDLESSEERALSTSPPPGRGDIEPEFSPDGTAIAFIRCNTSGFKDLWIVPTDGGNARCVKAGFLHVVGLEWARNSQDLLCPAEYEGVFSLWRVNVDSGEISWSSVVGEEIYTPSVARNTDRLVYHNYRSERNIWRLRLGGRQDSEVEPVVVSTHRDGEPSISPKGRYLAFTSTRSGSKEIWISELDGSPPYQLSELGRGLVSGLRWSPDGSHIAFHAGQEGVLALHIVELDGRRLRRLDSGFDNAFVSDWSKDGRWLYFSAEHEGKWNIWRFQLEGPSSSAVDQVTANGGIRGYESTDGYFYYSRPYRAGLWRIPIASIDAESSSVGEQDPWLPDLPQLGHWDSWTICDAQIYLLTPDDQESSVMRYDAVSGHLIEEARLPGFDSPPVSLSEDCKTCYFVRTQREHGDLMLVEGFR